MIVGNMKIDAVMAALAVVGIGLAACSETDSHPEPVGSGSFVAIHLADYETAGDEVTNENDLLDMRACLFENGYMTEVYANPVNETSGYGFKLDRDAGTLYVLTKATDIFDLDGLCNAGISEQEWLTLTVGTKDGLPIRFFSGTTVLTDKKEHVVKLSRGFARFDLRIRTVEEVKIGSLSFEGASLHTGLFVGTNVPVKQGTISVKPDAPITKDTPGVVFVYEQENPEAVLRAEVMINGKYYELEAGLPEKIRRNCIYEVTVVKEDADRDVQLIVEPWEEGEDVGMYPDWGSRIVIDVDNSEIPSGALVYDNGTGLILPHNCTDFLLALDCDNELDVLPFDTDALVIEPMTVVRGAERINVFRIRKQLYVPGRPADDIELRFKRKGLNNVYPEDRIVLHLSANPVKVEGELSFDQETYSFDFERYVDNELGRFIVPAIKELLVEFDEGEDPWIKLEPIDKEEGTFRVLGGWRPNDPTANGRIQYATLVIRNAEDGSDREEYRISRRNYGLPVTWLHGVWWCKYNARGNSRDFDDQILSSQDPAVAAGKSVFDYLRDCTAEEFYRLWGWAYQGDSGIGMRVIEENGMVGMENFSMNVSAHINKLPADALAPDGYELPAMEEFNRVFDAADYIWMMWSGTHALRTPWDGHKIIRREQRRRNDIVVGSVSTPDLIYVSMSSPDFPEYESVTWYGPGAQWDAAGIKHSNHYNNILFAVNSPEGSGWYMAGNMSALYMIKNGAGNRDTRILRFKKSPVEYIY